MHTLRLILLVSAAALCSCAKSCGEKPPEDWVASLTSFEGKVFVMLAPDTATVAAEVDQHLRIGGRLETRLHANASLSLRNGGHLEVQGNSVVTFSSSAPDRKLALDLLQGTLIGKASEVAAAELIIGVGQRQVRLANQARAKVEAPALGAPQVTVELGKATVMGPEGTRTLLAGQPLTLVYRGGNTIEPDAGTKPDAAVVSAREITYYVKLLRGRTSIKGPDDRRFRRLRRGRSTSIRPDTEIRVSRRARLLVGNEPNEGAVVSGPARLRVGKVVDDGSEQLPLRLGGSASLVRVTGKAKPGQQVGAPLELEGVRITPRVRHRQVDLRIRKERGKVFVAVDAGAALLSGKKGKLDLEAGQKAVLSRGRISGPQMPPLAPLQVRRPSTMRVFARQPVIPITLRWKLPAGADEALVEVARRGSFAGPIFSDRLKRHLLTLPKMRRGVLHWRVTPMTPDGEVVGKPARGRMVLYKDTSHRILKVRRLHNTIQLSSRTTTVFYQNKVPRFTFRWEPIDGAETYQIKILRENNLTKPLVSMRVRGTSLTLKKAPLVEGNYLWYITGRNAAGKIVKGSSPRKLAIKYDNATPNLQIKAPRDGITAAEASIEASGVTIFGSTVSINNTEVELDKGRFKHVVALKPGINWIIFRVVDRKRRVSYYLRRVTRR